MARWWTRIALAAVLTWAMGGMPSSAQAQLLQRLGLAGPPADGPPPFGGGENEGPQGPDFPNVAQGPAASPFSLNADVTPNGLEEWPDHRYIPPDSYMFTFRAEYLRWRFKPGYLSTQIVTEALAGGTASLGEKDTVVRLGQQNYNYGDHDTLGGPGTAGTRLVLGIAPGFFLPVEVSGFWFNDQQSLYKQQFDGTNTIGRPVLAANLAKETVFVAGFANVATGVIDANTKMSLWGTETQFVLNIAQTDPWIFDLLFGYRYTYFGETLNIANVLNSVDPKVALPFGGYNNLYTTGFSTRVNDRFFARNDFNGGQIALRNILSFWRMNLFIDTKLAVGQTVMQMETTGISSLSSVGSTASIGQVIPGGILALPSNGGRQTHRETGVIPEINVHLGFQLTQHIRLFAGYDLMYWSRIVRPGNQLDNLVDTTQIPTDRAFSRTSLYNPITLPQRTFNTTSFWGQGYHFGFEFSF